MEIPEEFTLERQPSSTPPSFFGRADPYLQLPDDEPFTYWLHEGKVMWGRSLVRGADPETFRYFLGDFGKDRRACYKQLSRIRGADCTSFRALNYCYAADSERVWTIAGEVKGAHRASFEICDGGARSLSSGRLIPTGYARDRAQVYYYNFDGKPNVVKRADPASFRSLDGVYGLDVSHVFCEIAVLPAASPQTWRRLDGDHSIDADRVYYFHRRIVGADAATFRVIAAEGIRLAADAHAFYRNGVEVTREELDAVLAQEAELARKFPKPAAEGDR